MNQEQYVKDITEIMKHITHILNEESRFVTKAPVKEATHALKEKIIPLKKVLFQRYNDLVTEAKENNIFDNIDDKSKNKISEQFEALKDAAIHNERMLSAATVASAQILEIIKKTHVEFANKNMRYSPKGVVKQSVAPQTVNARL